MTWSYDPTLPTDKDKVRLKIADTVEADPLFQDEEITAVLAVEGTVLKAAIALARGLVSRYSRVGGTIKADDVSVDVSYLYKQSRTLLEDLLSELPRKKSRTRGGSVGMKVVCVPKRTC